MNQKKAKALRRISYKLSRGQDYLPEMKVKQDAVFETITDDNGKEKKKMVKQAKFQRVLSKMGAHSIHRRLKKLYLQKKIRISINRKEA